VVKYFSLDTTISEQGIVSLVKSNTLDSTDSDRFSIFINIPPKSKPFFFPNEYWQNVLHISPSQTNIRVDDLSGKKHGCLSNGFHYTEPVTYKPPFFIIFKSNQALTNNFLKFNNFFNSPSNKNILSMLVYEEEDKKFTSTYSPLCIIPFSNAMSLASVLEFYILDSNGLVLEVADFSQLFISLKTL